MSFARRRKSHMDVFRASKAKSSASLSLGGKKVSRVIFGNRDENVRNRFADSRKFWRGCFPGLAGRKKRMPPRPGENRISPRLRGRILAGKPDKTGFRFRRRREGKNFFGR
ncbi:MAG: hypothetical protein LBF41_06615, partial [Deltaproteobacteria bacterium]|nr:hypothetical protein [Deltaproteobacteria bacterium]